MQACGHGGVQPERRSLKKNGSNIIFITTLSEYDAER